MKIINGQSLEEYLEFLPTHAKKKLKIIKIKINSKKSNYNQDFANPQKRVEYT